VIRYIEVRESEGGFRVVVAVRTPAGERCTRVLVPVEGKDLGKAIRELTMAAERQMNLPA